jgi:TRAP-type C4-dicarboxylate transport system permease small subunit
MGLLSGLSILLVMFLTTTDFSLRFAFNLPLKGVYELSELILVITTFLGLAYTWMVGEHIDVDIVYVRLSPAWQRLVRIFVISVLLIIIGLLAGANEPAAINSIRIAEVRYGPIPFPMWPSKLVIALGSIFFFIYLLFELVDTLRKKN